MKKTYNNPHIEVIKIQTVCMLAASLTKEANGVDDESKVLGRDYDFDYEDEE